MPTRKVKGGYRWGKHGKIYQTKEQADAQGRAVHASGYGGPVGLASGVRPRRRRRPGKKG